MVSLNRTTPGSRNNPREQMKLADWYDNLPPGHHLKTLSNLALEIGTTQSSVRGWVRGVSSPPLRHVYEIKYVTEGKVGFLDIYPEYVATVPEFLPELMKEVGLEHLLTPEVLAQIKTHSTKLLRKHRKTLGTNEEQRKRRRVVMRKVFSSRKPSKNDSRQKKAKSKAKPAKKGDEGE